MWPVKPSRDIVPIFVVDLTRPALAVSYEGTGFIIARNLLITCWHCVSSKLEANKQYAAMIWIDSQGWKPFFLSDIEQDANGSDLASANVKLEPTMGLTLANQDAGLGAEVWTYGYPFTDVKQNLSGETDITLHPRYLQGYVMRSFNYQHPQYGRLPSYELDMPAPEGLSGAPLIRQDSKEVIGVLYGNNDVGTIDHFSRIDPVSGKQEPEIQRVVSFALAHHIRTLRNLQGTATQKLSLSEYLRT